MLDRHERLRVQSLHLRGGTTRVQAVADDCEFHVVHGEGGGCVLEVTGSAVTAWMPLRGCLQVHTPKLSIALHARNALVTEPEVGFRATACANSIWFALLGGQKAWELLMAGTQAPGARLLPAVHVIDRTLRHKILAFARKSDSLEDRLVALANEIALSQAPLHAAIMRSPGRTFATKLQVFLRLQRVRIFIAANCEKELDNDSLARIANYSPCHFLRTFKTVFLETPHACLVNQRLRRAEHLLRAGDLAVTEVAFASGFENRSAFSRRYRKHFGMTASATRRINSHCG